MPTDDYPDLPPLSLNTRLVFSAIEQAARRQWDVTPSD